MRSTGEDVIVGVDIGTTAVKIAAFSVEGREMWEHTGALESDRRRPGWAEQDPDAWLAITLAGLERLPDVVDSASVRSLGVVSQVNTHVFVDADLIPVLPAITWQDQRCAELARELDTSFSPEVKLAIWGGPFALDASYLVSRAAWVARHCPQEWARTRWVLSPKDYVIARLTGTVSSDVISSIGLVDAVGGGYLGPPIELVDGLAERLPLLRSPESVAGNLRRPRRLEHVAAVTGTMDAFGNIFGSATAEPGRAMLSCGTSIIVAGSSTRTMPQMGVISFPRLGYLQVHAGPTQAGGDSLRWWAQACGTDIETVLARSEASSPGAGGVVFAPHLAGQRAPLWDSDIRGSFLGLGTDTSADDLARAVLEGVAFSARAVLSVVEVAADMPMTDISISGGGSRSDHWCQIFADVLDRPLRRVATPDTAALGAALLGGVGISCYADVAAAGRYAVAFAETVEPDPGRTTRYDRLFAAYEASYVGLRTVHDHLASWRATS